MPKWLEIAWEDQGVKEIAGPEAEPTIIQFFKDSERPDIVSDEISWCAAWVGSCLGRASIPNPIPRDDRLLARAYLQVGTPIDKPRIGAIAVLTRGDPKGWQGHVGFVVGETETTIALLGGNQGNAVSVQHFAKSQVLGYRWPAPAKTPEEVAAAGSRTAAAAGEITQDAKKAAGSGGSAVLVDPSWVPDLSGLAASAGQAKTAILGLNDFLTFAADKWPTIAVVIAAWFVGRMAVKAIDIGWLRAADENSGRHEAAATVEGEAHA